MTLHAQILRLLQQEDLNFLLTNRIPRRLLTRFMGWFQHGSTILIFAPDGFSLHEDVREGGTIRVGEPLMRLP